MSKENDWYSQIGKLHTGMVADAMASIKTEILPLPSPSMNWALGGGFAFGRIYTIYGPYSSGKSMIALMAVAELHKTDPKAWGLWYDAEMCFDKDYAAKLGVDLKRLWIIQSNKPQDIFDHLEKQVEPMIQSGFPCRLMVIDSIKSIQGPKEAGLKTITDFVRGDLSTLLPKAFNVMVPIVRKHKLITLLLQQVTDEQDQQKIMRHIKWHVPGGNALLHVSDMMIMCEKVEAKDSRLFNPDFNGIQGLPIQIGHTVRCKIDKSKISAPYLSAEFMIKYGTGVVEPALEVVALAIELGIVSRPTKVAYNFGAYKAIGRKEFEETVKNTPELYRELLLAINSFDVSAIPTVGKVQPPATDIEE